MNHSFSPPNLVISYEEFANLENDINKLNKSLMDVRSIIIFLVVITFASICIDKYLYFVYEKKDENVIYYHTKQKKEALINQV
jgi:hypothetical protein